MAFDVGDHRAVRPLGPGRSARVWLADPVAGGEAHVLVLHDSAQTAQVELEFRIGSALSHPHLLPVLATTRSTGQIALVTEFAPGGSLRDRLTRGTLTEGQTVTVLAAVADALAACHAAGTPHGNVAAGTVLFTGNGRPMLAGLGAVGAAAELGATPRFSPGYLSPDLARGATPSPPDDVFALGSLALHCLTGAPAWPAEDIRDVVLQSAFGQWPGPSAGTSSVLSSLIDDLLGKEPAARPSAAEVHARLAQCSAPEPVDLGPLDAGLAPAVPEPPLIRRGRHAQTDDSPDEPLGRPSPPPQPPLGWLEVDVAPSWALGPPETVAAKPSAEEQDEAATLAVTPLPVTRAARSSAAPRAHRIDARASVLLAAVIVLLAAGAVAAGLWWATADAPAASTQLPTSTSSTSSDAVSGGGSIAHADVDWLAVVANLDRRRADAFTAGSADLLASVYAPSAPGLPVDAGRIRQFESAGLRVHGLVHEIRSVTPVGGSPPALQVVESMAAHDIVDASGAVVGHTAEQPEVSRTWSLTNVGGSYLIVDISAAG